MFEFLFLLNVLSEVVSLTWKVYQMSLKMEKDIMDHCGFQTVFQK